MYNLPNMQLVYLIKKFNQSPEVLYDDIQSAVEDDQSQQHNMLINQNITGISQSNDNIVNNVSVLVKPEEVLIFFLLLKFIIF